MKNCLNNLLKKEAVKNGAWMYLLQIFNTIVPLLTLPYITRILGAAQYGFFSIAINIVGYYQVVVEYGFEMSATRKVALSGNRQNDINHILTSVIVSRCLLLAICFLITGIYVVLNRNDITQSFCLLILMIMLFGNCIQLNWLFQGMQQMQYISIINIVARVISVILIFGFVKTKNDLFLYCLLYSISPLISTILGFVLAKRVFNIKMVSIEWNNIWEEMKSGWYVFTTQLSSKVFSAIGITFMGIFASSSEVGVYSAIQKIPNIMLLAWIPISQVVYPISSKRMHSSFQEGKAFVAKLRKLFLPLFILAAGLVAVFSRPIILIVLGAEYEPFFYWVIPLLMWMIVSINNNFLGIQTLLGSGHDKEYSKCFQIGVACTVLFNFVLIYLFKGNGACYAPLLSEIVLGIVLTREVKKLK